MTLAEAIDVAERNKGNGLPEPLVRTALDVLYEELKRRPLQFGRDTPKDAA